MTKEYGDIAEGDMATRTILATSGKYRLIHSTAGFECAGSCARSTEEKWGVLFDVAGCPNGRWFGSLIEAQALFAKWTHRVP